MGDFAQMHIFFAVTTATVVIVGILVAIALYYIVSILRTIDKLSKVALEEGELIREDIADLRESVRNEGKKLKSFAKFGKKFAERFSGDNDKGAR
jgi:hypothetical protein